jgi:hypothetical protein
MTTSFGSICFGSLLVAIVQALKALAQEAQNNGDAAIFACIAQCILGCLQSILEYFNKCMSIAAFLSFAQFVFDSSCFLSNACLGIFLN